VNCVKKYNRLSAKSPGFTLVELVVVVLILGVLATVAAPRFVDKSKVATENGFRHSLTVVRDAIAAYAAHNGGALPAQDKEESTFKKELRPYLRRFPQNPYGDADNARVIKIYGDGAPLATKVSGAGGWLFDCQSGEFIANSVAVSSEVVKFFEY
jgi:prepilin-type N-terminal cleavage/methylation domain-containing protein